MLIYLQELGYQEGKEEEVKKRGSIFCTFIVRGHTKSCTVYFLYHHDKNTGNAWQRARHQQFKSENTSSLKCQLASYLWVHHSQKNREIAFLKSRTVEIIKLKVKD